jgi:hypothetical protein
LPTWISIQSTHSPCGDLKAASRPGIRHRRAQLGTRAGLDTISTRGCRGGSVVGPGPARSVLLARGREWVCFSTKDAASWAAYVENLTPRHRAPTGPGGSGQAWHATTPPWVRVEPAPAALLCQRRRSPSLCAALDTRRARVRATGAALGDNIQVVAACDGAQRQVGLKIVLAQKPSDGSTAAFLATTGSDHELSGGCGS